VGFDANAIGELGAQLVLQEIGVPSERRRPVVMSIKPKLIVRGSTGPAAARVANRTA
jgi:hypothetical protein